MKTAKYIKCGIVFGFAALTVVLTGCAGAQRSAPAAVPVLNMNLDREDYTILDTVEKSSEMTSYCGIVHIIDNDPSKMIIFGYRTFEDQYEIPEVDGIFDSIGTFFSEFFSGGSPTERANYKALTAAEAVGADIIIPKRVQETISGFKPFYSVRTATVKGRAAKLKDDVVDVTK